jgi:hypothetical protein
MDFTIYASEIRAMGLNPSAWQTRDPALWKAAAAKILRLRGTSASVMAAHLVESNNPNALQRLQLVWN